MALPLGGLQARPSRLSLLKDCYESPLQTLRKRIDELTGKTPEIILYESAVTEYMSDDRTSALSILAASRFHPSVRLVGPALRVYSGGRMVLVTYDAVEETYNIAGLTAGTPKQALMLAEGIVARMADEKAA